MSNFQIHENKFIAILQGAVIDLNLEAISDKKDFYVNL